MPSASGLATLTRQRSMNTKRAARVRFQFPRRVYNGTTAEALSFRSGTKLKSSDDYIKGTPAVSGGQLTSKPMCSNAASAIECIGFFCALFSQQSLATGVPSWVARQTW